jgi:tetratricopeptide (TPR) repeat protein
MSFRHNLTAILLYSGFAFFASCASSDHPVATTSEQATKQLQDTAPIDGDTAQNPDFLSLARLAKSAPEDALNQLDNLLASSSDLRLQLLFGQASLNLLEQRQIAGKLGPGLAADLFSDANAAFSLCLSSNDLLPAALRGLARTSYRQGNFVSAWDQALKWHATTNANFNLADHELIGEIGLGRVVAEYRDNAGETAASHIAAESFEAALQLEPSYSTYISLADLHTWQQRPQAAALVLADAIKLAPGQAMAYHRLRSLTQGNRNLHTATLKQICFDLSTSASALWYYGESLYLQAKDARFAADYIKAMDALGASQQVFEQSAILDDSFHESCHDWISIIKTQRVWLLRDDQRTGDAIASVIDALDYDPSALRHPVQGDSLSNAINYLVSDLYQQGEIRKAISLLRHVCKVDDSNSLFVNNLGLFTRDLARSLSEEGHQQSDETQQLFQESWDVYSRLVELMPEDPRSINDRALIAIYYLDEHHQFAVQELHRAISIGEALLAEMDDNVPEVEHRYVDEAVGDAYENLAYYQVFRLNQVGDAEKLLNISNNHYPFDERNGVIMIRKKLAQIRQ